MSNVDDEWTTSPSTNGEPAVYKEAQSIPPIKAEEPVIIKEAPIIIKEAPAIIKQATPKQEIEEHIPIQPSEIKPLNPNNQTENAQIITNDAAKKQEPDPILTPLIEKDKLQQNTQNSEIKPNDLKITDPKPSKDDEDDWTSSASKPPQPPIQSSAVNNPIPTNPITTQDNKAVPATS